MLVPFFPLVFERVREIPYLVDEDQPCSLLVSSHLMENYRAQLLMTLNVAWKPV